MSPSTAAILKRTAPPALVVESLTLIEKALGGRDKIVAALAHAPKSRDLDYLLGLIGDPRTASEPLANLCAQGGITPGELIEAYKSGEIARAQALATQKVGDKLAAVAEDTMARALPQTGTCRACEGTGTFTPEPTKKKPNPAPEKCLICFGVGTVTVVGDLEHKKLALEMGKLLQKGGGVSLNVNQQVGVLTGASSGGSLERMQAATDAILYGAGDSGTFIGDPVPLVEEEEECLDAETTPAVAGDEPATLEGEWREAP